MGRGRPTRDGLARLAKHGSVEPYTLPAHDDHYDVEGAVPCQARHPRLMLLRRADEATLRPQTPTSPDQASTGSKASIRGFDDTQTGMLLGIPRSARCVQRFDDSRKICNSHYLSRFAASFIDARAKRSVAESCIIGFAVADAGP